MNKPKLLPKLNSNNVQLLNKKNMKRVILVITIFLIIQSVSSQEELKNFEVVKTEVFKEIVSNSILLQGFEDELSNSGVLRYFKGAIPAGSQNWVKGITIQKWDVKGKMFLNKIFILDLPLKHEVGRVFYNRGKYYVFDFFRNKKSKSLDYFINVFTEKGLQERKKVFSVELNQLPKKYPKWTSGYDFDYRGYFSFSENKDYILYTIDADVVNEEQHKFFVFNKNLELLYQKEFSYEWNDLHFELQNIEISNEGVIYFSGKKYNGSRKEKSKNKVNYSYEIFKISETEQKSLDIEISDFFVRELRLKRNKNRIVAVGFCSKFDAYKKGGIAFFDVDAENLVLNNTSYEPFRKQFYSDKYGADMSYKNLSAYQLKDILILNDGGCIITAEEEEISSSQYGVSSVLYNDLMVVNFSKERKMKWSRNINKKIQRASPVIIDKVGNPVFFVNAYKELSKLDESRVELKSRALGLTKKNSNLFMIKLNVENGNPQISVFQHNEVSETVFKGGDTDRIGDSKLFFLGRDKKTLSNQFMTIKSK